MSSDGLSVEVGIDGPKVTAPVPVGRYIKELWNLRDWYRYVVSYGARSRMGDAVRLRLADGTLYGTDGSFNSLAEKMEEDLLPIAQRVVGDYFHPDVICSLKLPTLEQEGGVKKRFIRCYYPPSKKCELHMTFDKVQFDKCYAGRCIRGDHHIFIRNLWKEDKVPFEASVYQRFREHIHSIIVWPIRIHMETDVRNPMPVAAFKVLFPASVRARARDNSPTKRVIKGICDHFAYAFQAAWAARIQITDSRVDPPEAFVD